MCVRACVRACARARVCAWVCAYYVCVCLHVCRGRGWEGEEGGTHITCHQYCFRFQQVAVVVMIVLMCTMGVYMSTCIASS